MNKHAAHIYPELYFLIDLRDPQDKHFLSRISNLYNSSGSIFIHSIHTNTMNKYHF